MGPVIALLHSVLVSFTLAGPAQASSPAPPVVDLSESFRAMIVAAPTETLSAKVSADRMTALATPPVPARVVSPLPVVLRISDRPETVPISKETYDAALGAIDRGIAWLRTSQGPNGGWMEESSAAGTDQQRTSSAATLAVTGLVLKAFAQRGLDAESDANGSKAIDFLRANAWIDGKFNPDPSGALGNYAGSFIVSGLAAVNSARTREWVTEGVAYLRLNQWDQRQGIAPDRDWFGGAGYGNGRRPDLSNTQVFLDALHDAGIQPTDPAVQKALIFVSRCQNDPEFNRAAWADDGTKDGGMVYTPANGGESMASAAAGEGRAGEKLPAGTPRSLRSYGSMTYAGFKSLLYAGLTADDPRVKDALAWIQAHWTFAENPGMGQEGRYYYLHAMSRALAARGEKTITESNGATHEWRRELIEVIVGLQQPDGSFRNAAERWMESKPELATAYLVLALEEAIKPSLTLER